MHLGCGEFKISGTDVGLVRNLLNGGLTKCWEGEPSLKLARETAKVREVGPVSVINVLLGSVAGGINFWGGYLNFVGRNVQESGGIERGIPQTGDGSEGQSAEGRDLDKHVRGKGTQ